MGTTGNDNQAVTVDRPADSPVRPRIDEDSHPVCVLDRGGKILRFNTALLAITGKSPGELAGRHCWEVMHGTTESIDNCPTLRAMKSRQRETLEMEVGGRWFEIVVDPLFDTTGRIDSFVHTMRDITAIKLDSARITNLNRIYRVMSSINQIIVHGSEPEEIFNKACRIAVNEGGFRMAWVGLLNGSTGGIEPVVCTDGAEEYLDRADITVSSGPGSSGPTARAVLTGRHVVCNDIKHDPRMAPWREKAIEHGYRASIALPLTVNGRVCGSFNLYTDTPGFFDEEEEKLLVGLASDISFALEVAEQKEQHRRSDRTLFETAERLTVVMDSINALIYVADLETYEILFTNEYGRNIWGDITGRICWQTLQSGQAGPCPFCTNSKLLDAEGNPTGVYCWEFENTVTKRWYDCRDQAISWHDGRLVRMEIATDITDRKIAVQSLMAKEDHLSTLVETIPDLVWLKDANGVYQTCNRMFENFFGASKPEIVGKTDYDFVDREQADSFRDRDRVAIAAGMPSVNEEWVTFADDGHRALLETIKTPMYDRSGQLIGVLGVARDITRQRKLEEQLRHAQKMESVGTLAGGIAHDFNNILTAITGYADITLLKMADADRQRPYVAKIIEAADRAAQLTKGLLLFSRKHPSTRKPIDLNDTIRKVELFLKRIIREDISYTTSLHNESLPLFADSYQIEQVVINLATNACDAMPNGGSLAISTDRVYLDETFIRIHGYGNVGWFASLTATDNGMGMDEATRLRIFEPFFTTKEVGKGTGLGLSVVYGIVKQHEGFINVFSEPGRGTAFHVYLPIIAVEGDVAATPPQPPAPAGGGSETILLAEDDEMVRMLTSSVLEEFGYRVITAIDGADAVQKFTENSKTIDLTILDLIMPNMNGHEALKEIRNIRPGTHAIFVSGYAADAIRNEALLNPDVPLLSKPITPTALLQAVRSALNGAESGQRGCLPSS